MFRLLCLTSLVVSFAASSAAQTVSATAGAINGRVTDATKAVLPGVSVTASGTGLMGTRSSVTDSAGFFRFIQVPPGEYTLVYELSGLTTVRREGIRVGVGFTATVNVEMSLAGVRESVTVQGASPVVDAQSTQISSKVDAQQLDSIPSARDYWAVLATTTPAVQLRIVDVGGNQAMLILPHIVYGTQSQHRYMQEGMNVTESNSAMGYSDWGSFDEISVVAAAHGAEMPNPGILGQFVSKSGGNKYRGRVYADYSGKSMGTTNIDNDQIARGLTSSGGVPVTDLNRNELYGDFNADLGGFIKKDKLWWYASYRYTKTSKRIVNLEVPQLTSEAIFTAKLTYNLTPKNKFIAYYTRGTKNQPDYLDAFTLGGVNNGIYPPNTAADEKFPHGVWKVEYNRTIGNAMFFEIRAGNYFYDFIRVTRDPDRLRYEDVGNNIVLGGTATRTHNRSRPQVLGSLSFSAGSHDFKIGGEVLRELIKNPVEGFPGDLLHVLRNGAPLEVYLFETPSTNAHGQLSTSGFVNDVWRVSRRMRLNLGLRFDRYKAFLPKQEHPAGRFNPTPVRFEAVDNLNAFNNWGPRVGASYDVTGNGKTLVKANLGQYAWNPAADFGGSSNPNSTLWFRRYAWSDLNGNRAWDPGEEGGLLATAGGAGTERLDPNLKNTYTREAAAWIERELMPNFGVRTGFVWRGERQRRQRFNINQPFEAFTIPVTIPDPGPDGRGGTADDGPAIAGFNLDPQYLGRPTIGVVRNIPNSDSDFYTWEITGSKRMSRRWSLLTSFAHTWSRESVNPLTQNDLINTRNGRNYFTSWQAKINGTLELPAKFQVTPVLRHQSGFPFGRTFVASLNYGNPTIRAEPFNTRRHRNITIVDVRVEKKFTLWQGRVLSGFVDVYNMFNTNPEQNLVTGSGSSWLRPLTIVGPRIARIGGKFEW